jgi:SAM-dependent methyltransferase
VTTELLLPHSGRMVALELDSSRFRSLRTRLLSSESSVVAGDATNMPLRSGVFSSVVAIMVLHHVWPRAAQDRLIAEVSRVLRPGGVFAGVEAMPEAFRSRVVHLGDRVQPVDAVQFRESLLSAGFEQERIDVVRSKFKFRAERPIGGKQL